MGQRVSSKGQAAGNRPFVHVLRVQLALAAAILCACAPLPPRPEGPATVAIAPAEGGRLDRRISPAEARHPGESGFRLLAEGKEAFMLRAQSARIAVRSLDVQTYIWHSDLTGASLAVALLEAADRAVRVRLLVDDLDARSRNDGFAALAAHPHIDVRLFNPWVTRKGTLAAAGEGALNFKRINRRMHNKSWIADNRIAIVGGRNVGDEYFGAAAEMNFVDLDFAMIGPVVRDVSGTFDRFWNSESAFPMEVLDPEAVNEAALARLRERLAKAVGGGSAGRYAEALRADNQVARMLAGDWPMEWSSKYEFVSDDPRKVTMKKSDVASTHVGTALVPMMQAARSRITIISPYFVPGEEATAALAAAAGEGKSVRILTNSLVANDVAEAGSGFGTETNRVSILGADGSREDLPLLSKREVADRLLDRVVDRLEARDSRGATDGTALDEPGTPAQTGSMSTETRR